MGTVSTQTRVLDRGPVIQDYVDGVWRPYLDFSSVEFVQKTTSYRTKSSNLTPNEEFTAEAKEFSDVRRNAFTETNPRYDNGHDFYTTKTSWKSSHPNWDFTWHRNGLRPSRMRGPLIVATDDNRYYGLTPPGERDYISSFANEYGSKAISSTIPTKSPVSIATAFGELLEGFPAIIGLKALANDRKSFEARMGNEYLNYTFGWVPLINDLRGIMTSVKDSSRILKQYHRDAGRQVRRRRSFEPIEKKTSSVGWNNLQHPYTEGVYGMWTRSDYGAITNVDHERKIHTDTTIKHRIWFSGAYSYALNTDKSLLAKFDRYEQEANRLLGTRITPETLWELAPWSWLADWAANIGNIVTNATLLGSDGLVLRYGYLMCHTKETVVTSLPQGVIFGGHAATGPVFNTAVRETKQRIRATPYGFGLSASSFSAKQWAILGALGLTKSPRTLF